MLLRDYQKRIVNEVSNNNSIVVLPTGAGKTLISIEVIKASLNNSSFNPLLPQKVIFFVPTVMLVEQQDKAIRANIPNMTVIEFYGGQKIPDIFNIIVATPKAFQITQKDRADLHWRNFSLVVFDEVNDIHTFTYTCSCAILTLFTVYDRFIMCLKIILIARSLKLSQSSDVVNLT